VLSASIAINHVPAFVLAQLFGALTAGAVTTMLFSPEDERNRELVASPHQHHRGYHYTSHQRRRDEPRGGCAARYTDCRWKGA